MDTRIGQKFETTRLALVALAMLSLVLVAALGSLTPERADAHQTAGRTLIYVDGELVKSTKDDHFAYEKRLSPGCHTVKVVQKRGGEVISSSIRRFCSDEPTKLIVKVDDGSVSSTTRTVNSTNTTSDSA